MPAKNQTQELSLVETIGFSMWPSVRGKDRLVVEKSSIEALRRGDIIVYLSDDKLICHRLIYKKRTNSGFILHTRQDNAFSYLTERIPESCFRGRVSALIRNGKLIPTDAAAFRLSGWMIIAVIPLYNQLLSRVRALLGEK